MSLVWAGNPAFNESRLNSFQPYVPWATKRGGLLGAVVFWHAEFFKMNAPLACYPSDAVDDGSGIFSQQTETAVSFQQVVQRGQSSPRSH